MIQLEGKTNFQEYAMIKSNRPKALDDLLAEQITHTHTQIYITVGNARTGNDNGNNGNIADHNSNGSGKSVSRGHSSLENTISLLSPFIKEMDRLNQELGDSNKREEIIRLFLQQLEEGEALVSKCSSIRRWNLYKKRKYEKRLRNMESSLRERSGVLQFGQALDTQRLQRVTEDQRGQL
ncbi:hypothetical protein CUMW_250340 [Citrus unshiu]|uniref:RPW8 domain-containing protein n=1 Tax=Citrus unshiu TaxID=55188 RepID=A0A2H5QPS8_CITUN|nr:hypothetical protein CUMW_250340 [Citrus unshiu]